MSKTRINEDRPMIPAHLLTPYSVGEVIKRSTTISGNNAAHLTVLPMRPMGKVSIEGDVELAQPLRPRGRHRLELARGHRRVDAQSPDGRL